ncbi:MAG: aspartate aminotransferase family protein, partial [Bacteroidetes bacterium]
MEQLRETPIEIGGREFREIGYQLVDSIAGFLDSIRERAVTPAERPEVLQDILGDRPMPEKGSPAHDLVTRAADLVINHSLLNGHPKFMGYVTSSASPIGALADLLASSVNPNVGANKLSPIATEIEKQTIRWLSELIGLPAGYGGILVSGGNMANFTGFLAARNFKTEGSVKKDGLNKSPGELLIYCSTATHTWIEKAATLFGHGTGSIRWIPTLDGNTMDNKALKHAIEDDLGQGYMPFLVVGTAGDVSTGAVDKFDQIGAICKYYGLWFHIDGAYGIPAAILPEFKALFAGIEMADSIALDPHKWLYSPLEVGCTLVKDPKHLVDTYSSHPVYYNFSSGGEGQELNYYEYGLQNSRGFRALKVWLTLQHAGKTGFTTMIAEDIRLSRLLFDLADKHPDLEAVTHSLSIATFRFVPPGYTLNTEFLNE